MWRITSGIVVNSPFLSVLQKLQTQRHTVMETKTCSAALPKFRAVQKASEVGLPTVFCYEAERQKRNPQLRGETSAHLMRRTAVRQSPHSLHLWCLSMLNTHSMKQNILKYRTVIVNLQNTPTPLYKESTFYVFFIAGGLCRVEDKTVKGILSFVFTFRHTTPVGRACFCWCAVMTRQQKE